MAEAQALRTVLARGLLALTVAAQQGLEPSAQWPNGRLFNEETV